MTLIPSEQDTAAQQFDARMRQAIAAKSDLFGCVDVPKDIGRLCQWLRVEESRLRTAKQYQQRVNKYRKELCIRDLKGDCQYFAATWLAVATWQASEFRKPARNEAARRMMMTMAGLASKDNRPSLRDDDHSPSYDYDWTSDSHTRASFRLATGRRRNAVATYVAGLPHCKRDCGNRRQQMVYSFDSALIVLDRFLSEKRRPKRSQRRLSFKTRGDNIQTAKNIWIYAWGKKDTTPCKRLLRLRNVVVRYWPDCPSAEEPSVGSINSLFRV